MNRLLAEAEQRRLQGKPLLDLTHSSFHRAGIRCSDQLLADALQDYVRRREYRPDSHGDVDARRAICRFYAEDALDLPIERIFITASTSESYSVLFSALAGPGAKVLLPSPTYPLFEQLVEFGGLRPVYYHLLPERGWQPDPEEIEQALQRTPAALVLISPNNPTGAVLSEEVLRRLSRAAAEADVPVISDEVFSHFLRGAPNSGNAPRIARFAQEAGARICTLNGLSKICAAPDLKVAWFGCSGPWRESDLERLELVNDTYLNASGPSQHTVAALLGDHATRRKIVQQVENLRNVLDRWAERVNRDPAVPLLVHPTRGGIHFVVESACRRTGEWAELPADRGGASGFTNSPPLGAGSSAGRFDDEEAALELLRETGVLVHPGYFYGMEDQIRTYWVGTLIALGTAGTQALGLVEAFSREVLQ